MGKISRRKWKIIDAGQRSIKSCNCGRILSGKSISAVRRGNREICAFVDNQLIGSAGNNMIHDRDKTRHRAGFGISIVKEYWGLGIGRALTESCIECAKKAGFLQLELDVVADNTTAIELYKRCGFVEFGRNPRGFKTREGNWQELVLMRLELDSMN